CSTRSSWGSCTRSIRSRKCCPGRSCASSVTRRATCCIPGRSWTSPSSSRMACTCEPSSRRRTPIAMASGSVTISSDRIAQRFAELRRANRRAFVPYVTAGHPDVARSVALLQGLESAGADVVEVGVPFSDPMADGAVIQASSQKALEQGVRFDQVLEIISRASLAIPVVLFSYLNPLLRGGADALQRAADAGAHGALVIDPPPGAGPDRA